MEAMPEPSMKGPVITSTLFHILLFAITAIGMPFLTPDEVIFTPISVELVDIADVTQTNKPPAIKPKAEEKPITEELKPPPIEKPAPPEMTEEAPPEPVKPKPIEKKAEVEKPKPKPKVEPKKEETKPKKDFDTLLKNLAPVEEAEKPVDEPLETSEDANPEESMIAEMGTRLTMSEEDAIRQQITPCWNVPAGSKMAEELAVEVRVFMNRDGSIRDPMILDKGRYNRDTAFRAAADAAERALRNPRCTPLKYPPEKYNQMKNFIFRFDPSDML
jgi:outer membrane biosynthesis protein TonB